MDGKQIILASRARSEMQSRGIGLNARISVIRQPGQVLPSGRRRKIRQSLPGARGRLLLRVVVKRAPMACRVVRDFPHFSLTTGPKQGVFSALPRSVPPNYCV